ncbi:MAG: DUF465 domain-containing protein [Nitrospiraceae bacterium]|nr:DUF465 domain-containing protein [Nitrospiraceae bacterium]
MNEQEISEILLKENEEFRKLSQEHKHLKEILNDFNKKVHLTPEEEVEKKRVQKVKLTGKDRMAELVRDYKKSH